MNHLISVNQQVKRVRSQIESADKMVDEGLKLLSESELDFGAKNQPF